MSPIRWRRRKPAGSSPSPRPASPRRRPMMWMSTSVGSSTSSTAIPASTSSNSTRHREANMKQLVAALLVAGSGAALAQSVPAIPFDSVKDPLQLPNDIYFGEVTGVAVNSKGMVYVLSRGNTSRPAYGAPATQLLEFGADGKFIREIGKNLYAWSFGHTVRIDPRDNIWVTDKGSDMVVKFNPAGRVVMVFGRKQEASDEDTAPLKHPKPPLAAEPGRFRQVTDVAFDAAGNTFISDGYINSRVAKVDKDGNWLKSWGERGAKPGEFTTRH